jgi:hypothetical protein
MMSELTARIDLRGLESGPHIDKEVSRIAATTYAFRMNVRSPSNKLLYKVTGFYVPKTVLEKKQTSFLLL